MDTVVKSITKRMDELKPLIKRTLMERCEVDDDGHLYYKTNKVEATVQVKRSMPKADEGALQQLLVDKGLWDETKMEVANRNIVKQLWLEGRLTDSDLRSIVSGPKDPTTALKVETVNV